MQTLLSFAVEGKVSTQAKTSLLGEGYLSIFCGTGRCLFWGYLFQTVTKLVYHFHNFSDILRNNGYHCWKIIHNSSNYDPDLHSICGIMALTTLQNLPNHRHQSFGQNGTSPSDDRWRHSPTPASKWDLRNFNYLQ